jgi:DNA-binding MarR family transcriptional regulator
MYSSPVNESCKFAGDVPATLVLALLRAAQQVEGRIEAALGDAGLSLAKLSVLNHLVHAEDPLPLGQIAGRISCVKSNVTQLVDRLEADGLVLRVSDPYDRRCTRAAITEEGRNRYDLGAQILRRQEDRLLEEIDPAKREDFFSCLAGLGVEIVSK